MLLKFYALVATLAHLFLTVSAGCYKGGEKFSDLGDPIAISDALNRICDRIGGKEYRLGEKVSDCENIAGHSIDVSIKVKEDSDSTEGVVFLYKADCSSYMEEVTDCPHGGKMDVTVVGGHQARAAVMVDPQRAQC